MAGATLVSLANTLMDWYQKGWLAGAIENVARMIRLSVCEAGERAGESCALPEAKSLLACGLQPDMLPSPSPPDSKQTRALAARFCWCPSNKPSAALRAWLLTVQGREVPGIAVLARHADRAVHRLPLTQAVIARERPVVPGPGSFSERRASSFGRRQASSFDAACPSARMAWQLSRHAVVAPS